MDARARGPTFSSPGLGQCRQLEARLAVILRRSRWSTAGLATVSAGAATLEPEFNQSAATGYCQHAAASSSWMLRVRPSVMPLRLPWAQCRVSTGTAGHGMFCLRPTRMPLIPPRGRHPATSTECSEPVSETSSGTGREYSQSTVKLAAGLEPGRAGPAGQCTSTPSVKLGTACVSAETQTDLLKVERGQPVVNFLDTAECPFVDNIPNCFPLGDDLVFARSPWVSDIVEGVRVPMLLDTGAEVTILNTNLLHRLFQGQEFPDRRRSVRSLGVITLPSRDL